MSLSLVALALAAPAAQAAPKTLAGYVGGQDSLGAGGFFTQVRDIVVYTASTPGTSDDKIFTVEAGGDTTSRVQRLDGDGNFELAWGRDVVAAGTAGNTGTGFEICTASASCQRGIAGSAPGELRAPTGIAVNQSTGQVYVMDRDNQRVQEFTLAGAFVRQWGSAGSGNGQFGSVASSVLSGIAVDPVNGDVFVADPGNRRVQRFTSTGVFVAAFGGPGTGTGQFAAGEPSRVAVDDDHVVYMSDATASGRVQRYDVDGAAFLEPLACCTLVPAGTTQGLEVDPATGNLLVLRVPPDPANRVVREVVDPGGAAPIAGDTHTFDVEGGFSLVQGLGHSPADGNLYLAAAVTTPPANIFTGCEDAPPSTNCQGLIVLDERSAMAALLNPVLDPGSTTASASGPVNPGGGVARYRFQLCRSSCGVEASWSSPNGRRYLSGSSSRVVSTEFTGLQPNTAYQVRLRVSKQVEMDVTEVVVSSSQAFTTDPAAPSVRTLGSASRTLTSATLRGSVDPQGTQASYRFEWGPVGGALDNRVPIPDGIAGNGNEPQIFVEEVSGLAPGTTYEYRIVASNGVALDPACSLGCDTVVEGDTVRFTTPVQCTDCPSPIARSFELVSPADKIGGQGVGDWYRGVTSHALAGVGSYDGERFASSTSLGGVLVDGAYGYASDWALADRTPAGWVNKPAMTLSAYGRQTARMLSLTASNQDLSLSLWGTNGGTLRLFPEMRDWDETTVASTVLARDWAGNWEVVGPTSATQGGGASYALESRAVSDDGSLVGGTSVLRGLAGPRDPVLGSLAGAHNAYADDISAGLSNTFPGAGVRTVVNVCTEGTSIPQRLGSGEIAGQPCPAPPPTLDGRLIDSRGAAISAVSDKALEDAISGDGLRVFFMSPDPTANVNSNACSGTGQATQCPPQLYVRQDEGDGTFTTRWISRSEVAGQDASLLATVSFEGASADGDKVFFRTASPLTADDPNGEATPSPLGVTEGAAHPSSVDLYMYDFPDDSNADIGAGDLVRISAGPTGGADANVANTLNGASGALRFASADGGRAYFTTAAPVPGVPLADSGTITDPGGTPTTTSAANLYLYDASKPLAQRWRFIARLPRTSELGRCATSGSGAGSGLGVQDTSLSTVGKALVTGEGNCVRGTTDGTFVTFWTDGQLTSDDPHAASGDMYAYDAASDALTRISAPQGGSGATYTCLPVTSTVQCHGDVGFGGGSNPALGVATDPVTPGDRIAFFSSASQLVDEDVDDAYDVYQWRNGELSLVSTGRSEGVGALYQGNDRSGESVFFSTTDALTWQDGDAALDVYVARQGGGIPAPPAPPACDLSIDGCQGPGADSTSFTPPSSPGGGNADGRRVRLSVARVSRKARVKAARTGILTLRARVSGPTVVRAAARAKVGGKARRVAAARKRASKAGRVLLRLRLSKAAKRRLGSGRALRLRVTVKSVGAKQRALSISLKRGKR